MANAWFETVAEAQRRAQRRLPASVYGALIAGSEKGLSMRDNLQSLYLLMNKLYLRNPNQLQRSGYLDAATAERQIRLVFQRAREKASQGTPVIVFFDEMDSLFRTRGSGVSSDVENTIVPQLLSELDGVEILENVIVIGATNREDMIDPAILRPGRLDVKIKIERPDEDAARDIFAIYLNDSVPIHAREAAAHGTPAAAATAMIDAVVARTYALSAENEFIEVTYANGDKEVLYFKDFNSGAMIENIVRRAKKEAIKRFLSTGEKGIRTEDLQKAIRDEFKENEDLPNTTNPDDWARISGKKGERIVYVRTLLGDGVGGEGRQVERVSPGQYL